MKIKITTTNIDLTDALSSFVEEKMKHLDKLLKNDISADSVLCEVEIGINTKHHHSGKNFSRRNKFTYIRKNSSRSV